MMETFAMVLKYQIEPSSHSNEQEKVISAEDAWLNDVGPSQSIAQEDKSGMLPSSVSLPQMQEVYEQETVPLKPEYIGNGHALWPLVLRISTRIWQELYRKPDVLFTSTPVRVVQKRVIELLRAEPAIAQQVHNIVEAQSVLKSIVNEVLGYGPLEVLMKDEGISEIMVIGPRCAYVQRADKIEDIACPFVDDYHMERIIENMLRQAGQRMQPLVDVRLADGALVNVVMPPHAINGPTLTIRKCSRKLLTIADLVEAGTLTSPMADFLQACIQARLNIVICGALDSGRTTLLNALGACISAHERITTLEEIAELRLPQKHTIGLVSQPGSPDGANAITMCELVAHALRTGSGRILLGECRGHEIVELLQAMSNGLSGVLMTLYASDLRHGLSRLETLYQAAGTATPLKIIRTHIASSLDVIVHIVRLPDGSHKIVNIAEVLDVENDMVKLQSIFHYKDDGFDARTGKLKRTFEPSGFSPTFLPKLERLGITLPAEMFHIKFFRPMST
jgi:pilus assembly protein CpaF